MSFSSALQKNAFGLNAGGSAAGSKGSKTGSGTINQTAMQKWIADQNKKAGYGYNIPYATPDQSAYARNTANQILNRVNRQNGGAGAYDEYELRDGSWPTGGLQKTTSGGKSTTSIPGTGASGTTGGTTGGDTGGTTGGDTGGGTGGDVDGGFRFSSGGDEYSAVGLAQLINDPETFAVAWLQSMGPEWNTPTMQNLFGQYPAMIPQLLQLMYGDTTDPLGDANNVDTAKRYEELLALQLNSGRGIEARPLIQKMLDMGRKYGTQAGNADATSWDNLLAMDLMSGTPSQQVDMVNGMIMNSLVNSNPTMGQSMRGMLANYGRSYLADTAKVKGDNPAVSYLEWLSSKGLIF